MPSEDDRDGELKFMEINMKEYEIKDLGYKIRYFDFYGEDVPIIFIHGMGFAGSYDHVEVALQESLSNHRRIVIDLLGAGYSDKPREFTYTVENHAKYLNELIAHLGFKEIIICAHSFSGAVAIELGKLCPEKIKFLISAEGNLDPAREGTSSWKFTHLGEENFEEEFQNFIQRHEKGKNTMWIATVRNWLPKAVLESSKSAVKGGSPSWRETFYKFDFPKAYIFGRDSLPNENFDKLKTEKIHIEIVENAGHPMTWQNPKGLAEAICRCLKSK